VKTYDVAIAGGGLIGASIAFELAGHGLSVALLDRQQPGQEASWAAAGMLSPAPDGPPSAPLVPLALESLSLYPEFVSAIEEASAMTVGMTRKGALHLFLTPEDESDQDNLVADYRGLGLLVEPISIQNAFALEKKLAPSLRAAMWHANEATVDPRLLTQAVLQSARSRGADIFTDANVRSIAMENGRCSGLIAGEGLFRASHVVIAAGSHSGLIALGNGGGSIARYAPTRPIRGQLLALRKPGVSLERVVRTDRGYLVPRPDGRIIAGSTLEDVGFEKRVTSAGIEQILSAAIEMIPDLSGAEIVESWAGLRPGTPDELPILGPADIHGLLFATGHFRNGILLAPVTAKIISECIVRGTISQSMERFSPLRFLEHGKNQTYSRSAAKS
jgi:glycine oxidase